ncbi:MAG: hypothetical protein RLZZ399_298 [Verrucomicrobiota bacterium]|jgi:hypothetical protein
MTKHHRKLGLLSTAALTQLTTLLPASAQSQARTEFPSVLDAVAHAFHDTQTSGTYYRNSLSNSTTRDPDRPKYAGNFSQSWLSSLGGIYRPQELAWLDIGLETRLRYEYRDNDLRSLNQLDPKSAIAFDKPTVAGIKGAKQFDQTDNVFLQRTRLYLGVKDIIDPFRFAVEIADSRRYFGTNSRPVPTGDEINSLEPIRLYGELFFKDLLGKDPHGNARPLSLRYGIHNFEFLDRRIIANNQWRNTANTFQGFHGSIGQESNDWQIDLLAIQPLKRFEYDRDRVIDPIWVYGVIGHWRKWSDFITLEPFYFQRRNPHYIDSSKKAVTERLVHMPGIRAYGQVPKTGFDFDASILPQFGHKGDLNAGKLGSEEKPGDIATAKSGADRKAENIRALGYTAEVGYTLNSNPWKPRLSLFYGFASGDKLANPTYTQSPAAQTDLTDNRFERFYGFQRPWSAQDYIVFENISAPKVRLEFRPLANLRVDLGHSWFWLASGTDRYYRANSAAGTSRDYTEKWGKHIGNESDIRARYAFGRSSEIVLGYSYFKAGTFTEKNIWSSTASPNQKGDSNFAYVEISHKFL